MVLFDFLFSKKPITSLENDIIDAENKSGLFPENNDEICDSCGELLEDCECNNKRQRKRDAELSLEEIDELEDMEENDFDNEENW